MNFDDVQPTDSMHAVSLDVAEEFRQHIDQLYAQQHRRNLEIDGGMANTVLAGLTVVWLEAIHASWNTTLGESAISILQDICPAGNEIKLSMQGAARDFLRRSGWWLKRPK